MTAVDPFDKTSPENAACIKRAKVGEPMFVLLARDPAMAETVRNWCRERSLAISMGLHPNTPEEHEHIRAAMKLADAADHYWMENHAMTPQRRFEIDRRRRRLEIGYVEVSAETGLVNQGYSHDFAERQALVQEKKAY